MTKATKATKKTIIIILAMLILSFIIMSITFLFSKSVVDMNFIITYYKDIRLILMNFIPIFLFMVLMYLIFNKMWASFLATSLLFVTLSIVNRFKLTYRDDPFNFIELKLVKESMMMVGKYKISLSPKMIIMILALALFTFLIGKFFKYKIDSKKIRIISISAVIIVSIIIFKSFYFSAKIYDKVGDKSNINIWIKSEQFQVRGFVYPFIYSMKDAKDIKPEGYNKKAAMELLSTKEYKNIPENEKVNIVAVMLEAFNDFTKFEGVELNQGIYENFHNLQQESIHGKLVTKIFGGDTIKTEREFLTGFYNEPKYYKRTNSHMWYFKEQGYRVEGMHPITGSFYNRKNVDEYLGFDYFEHYDNRYKAITPDYLMDMDFFDYILEGYANNKNNTQPYISFSVTYQNHGPYPSEYTTEEQYLIKKPDFNEGNYNIINNYLSGINQTDKALKKLFDYFRNEEEPTILIIFGDHNPWLGYNAAGYEMLGINLDPSTIEGFENYYETPYIIWANDPAKETFQKDFLGEGDTISPNFLMAELFQYLGWEGNEFMQHQLDMKQTIDVMNPVYYKENGKYTKEPLPEVKEKIKDYLNIEYYYSH